MSHHHHHHHHHHHQAVDNLINVFARASHDLNVVHSKLDKEFQQIYPENANPMKLIQRIKKLQEDVTTLKDQCLELLSAKQDLIDKAQTTLVGNCNLIQKMNASLGESTNVDGNDAMADFNQIIDEWTTQVRSRTVGETEEADKEDTNKLFFSAIEHVYVHGYYVQTYLHNRNCALDFCIYDHHVILQYLILQKLVFCCVLKTWVA